MDIHVYMCVVSVEQYNLYEKMYMNDLLLYICIVERCYHFVNKRN